jgi:rRNA small subunit pseudouridine methyltransferase Nep1
MLLFDESTDECNETHFLQIEKETAQRLIVVLEKACLETVKAGNNYELLNCDDHTHILKKHKKDPADCRPDICHQVGEQVFHNHTKCVGIHIRGKGSRHHTARAAHASP